MSTFSGVLIHRIWGMAFVVACLGVPVSVQASSTSATHPVVQLGSGTVAGLGTAHVTVNQATQLMGINWYSLGNKPGEVLRFNQPSANAIVLNRIVGGDPSQFLGSLTANGSVIVINPNGVFFGPQSQVNVNGLIASSLNITDANFLSGRYAFQGAAINGAVKNEGQITAGPFGVYLLAPNVTNNGVIRSPDGTIALAAGTTAYLSDRPDGRGFLVEVTAPVGEALNLKSLIADGGQVSMIGRLVTQSGLVQANSVRQQNGKIELVASDRVTLTAGSVTSAKGDAQHISDGGTILAKSDLTAGQTTFQQGAIIDVSGGIQGGNAGSVELSGAKLTMGGSIGGRTAAGYRGGTLVLDPTDLTIDTAYFQTVLTPLVNQGMTNLLVQADNNLTVTAQVNLGTSGPAVNGTAPLGWILPTGQEGFLRLTAGNDLTFSANSSIQNGSVTGPSAGIANSQWSYALSAGNDMLFNSTKVITGGGGNLTLSAGRDITLVPGVGGGPTTLETFSGNMSITAGRNLIAPSAFPGGGTPSPLNQYSGIRLERSGNLTITTGGDFLGGTVNSALAGPGFVLSDGTATVTVGGNLGAQNNYANFTIGTLITNSTTNTSRLGLATVDVTAQNNIYLGLVQDRGLSDRIPGQPAQAIVTANPNSSVSLLSQQGSIHLQPPNSGTGVLGDIRQNIYPASFSASAPNGNIFIENVLQFWPSPVGTLSFLAGQSIQGISSQTTGLALYCPLAPCNPITAPASQSLSPITLAAVAGDISGLNLQLVDSYRQTVTISAGGNIRDVYGVLAVPNLGTDTAGHLIPAVTITAKKDIDFSGQNGVGSGFLFGGTGVVTMTAGGTLNLATSRGLIVQADPTKFTNEADKGGVLDVAVGGDIKMTQSRIQTNNGASLFIHGLDAGAPVAGTTATATSATLGVITVNGQMVLAVGGNPVLGPDGVTPIPVVARNQDLVGRIGSRVYLVGGRPVLDAGGLPVVVGPNDTILGKAVLVVNGTAPLGLNGQPVVVNTASSAVVSAGDLVHGTVVLDQPLVQLGNGTIMLVINGKTVFSVPPGTGAIDGRPIVNNGVVTLLVNGKPVSVVEPVGGSVDVGTNLNTVADQTGILTERGGLIDLKATGNVNVNLSRIATLGGGDITLTSTAGDINAGNGARTDVTQFPIQELNSNGAIVTTFLQVPGSGIFTFSPKDGTLPNIPPFNPISPFEELVTIEQFLGHDVSSLLPQVPAAHAAWLNQYTQSVQQLFAGFQLGNITLTAAHDVNVPPAGIRGRDVTINAGHNLNLQGGSIRGITNVNVGSQVVGSLTSFVGVFAVNLGGGSGATGGSTLGLGSITGGVGTITTSSAVAAGTYAVSATTTSAVNEAATSQPVNEPKTVAGRSNKKGGQQAPAGSLRVRDRVKIKVETKPEQAM